MKRACFIAAALMITATGAAQADGNNGGVLVFHTADTVYCADDGVAGAGVDCDENFGDCVDQEDCSGEITALNPTGISEFGAVPAREFYVLAAFPTDSCPRLAGVTFGINYDDANIFITDSGGLGDFELPANNWPSPFTGTAVTWTIAKKAELTEVYWFAAYAYYEAGLINLSEDPVQGGDFADDSIPPSLTEIAGFGSAGLGGATGLNPETVLPVIDQSWGNVKHLFSDGE